MRRRAGGRAPTPPSPARPPRHALASARVPPSRQAQLLEWHLIILHNHPPQAQLLEWHGVRALGWLLLHALPPPLLSVGVVAELEQARASRGPGLACHARDH